MVYDSLVRFKYHWVDLAICSAQGSVAFTLRALFCAVLEAMAGRAVAAAAPCLPAALCPA